MCEEDRMKYAMAQANQRAPGSVYDTAASQVGQINDISDAHFQKQHWSKSVESIGSFNNCPARQRATSYSSVTSGQRTPGAMSTSPIESINDSISNLPVPRSASGIRFGSRNARSPLARSSFVRTTSPDGFSMEMQEQTSGAVESRGGSSVPTAPVEESPRGRQPSRSSSN